MTTMTVDEWNVAYPPGTPVALVQDDETAITSKTRSEAWIVGSRSKLVLVDGKSGGYSLDRIYPLHK